MHLCQPTRIRTAALWLVVFAVATFVTTDRGYAQKSDTKSKARKPAGAKGQDDTPPGLKEYTSRNFVLRTDLTPEEAKDLLQRLEIMIVQVGRYWGKPNSQIIEMYVVKDLDLWPKDAFPPAALQSVSTGGGLTISQTRSSVNQATGKKVAHLGTKSVVYAVADRG
ncbi:MAG: hypothetical protein B7Z55_13135, partial [Planctomycetales bacterium 12-60-4]